MKLSQRLNSFLASARSAAGFTMIELLIVISILGILAVAVLSAINPVEQINRGRDTGSRSDAEQLLSAMDRFNAFQGYYPWVYNPNDDYAIADPVSGMLEVSSDWFALGTLPGNTPASGDCPILARLSEGLTGTSDPCNGSLEIKQSFVQRLNSTGYNPLYVYNEGGQGDSTYICFVPQSGAFVQEAETRCGNESGVNLPSDISDATVIAQICGGHSGGGAVDPSNMMICLP